MPSPAGRYTRSGLCDEVVGVGFCPQTAFGREPVDRRLAKCDAGSSRTGGFFPPRRGFSALDCRTAPAFSALPARRRNVGFSRCAAHTLAAGAENRTQRQHAAHGALWALGAPAGSIVPIFFTGEESALSARLREIHRLPLLRYVSAKIPFSLRATTLSRISRVIFFGVMPRLLSGSIFADSADGEPRYSGSARSNSEKRCTS